VSLAFRDAVVSGNVNPQWMRKKTADFRELLHSELARERRVTLKEGQKYSIGLSVDGKVDSAAQEEYDRLHVLLIRALKSNEEADEAPCRDAAIRMTRNHPGVAVGWYWRGVTEEWSASPREALKSFEQALQRQADFPEALCAKARLLIMAGETKTSRTLVEKALALKPDLGEGHLLLGRLDYEAGKPAMESVALSRRLAPEDLHLQIRAQELLNVLRGPLWPKVNKAETAHYTLRSDLPTGRCRELVDHLEAMRGIYEETLGLPSGESRRSDLLVYNAPEGFYQYMDTTSGGRSESVLGYFDPWYGQMVLYEDQEPDETLRVIAHEGFHQYLHGVLMSAPTWFNEGMAEYVGAAKIERGRVVEKVRLQEGRLLDLKLGLKYGWQPDSFSRIMVESRSSFYGEKASFKYAQAWSMVHFFMNAEKGRWKDRMTAYAKRLYAGDNAEEAYASVFAKENIPELESAWLSYVKGLGAPLPGTPTPGAAAGVVDLMKMVDLKVDVVEGEWAFSQGKMVCGKKPWTRVQLPLIPPEEYDLTIVAARADGNDALLIGLAHPTSQFMLVVDGWKSTIVGLTHLDGKFADNNDTTTRRESLKPGKSATIVISVRKDGVAATLDGKPLVDYKGPMSRLTAQGDMRMPNPKTLFIGSYDTKFVFSKIQLTPVSGEGKKLR
jgi:tetratricopeptide (TPR) repeat protein